MAMAAQFQNVIFALIFVSVLSFVFFISPISAAEEPNPTKPAEPVNVVAEFCNRRQSTEDRAFCSTVLKLNPVSAIAKNNTELLKIAIDLAVNNAKNTRDFFAKKLSEDATATPSPLKPVLEGCVSAYDASMKQLLSIRVDLQDDPPMASYDAKMANQELDRCVSSLTTSKLDQDQIVSRNNIAVANGKLCAELTDSL